MLRKLDRFKAMSWPERRSVAQATVLLPFVAASLRLAGFQKTYRWLEGSQPDRPQAVEAWVSESVDMAMRNFPFYQPTCLSRSLVLWHMLRRQGTPAELHIGVRKADGDFVAHAWVEHAGQVINDAPDIAERFAPLDTLAFRLEARQRFQ